MTQRHQLEQHRQALKEVRGIMNSMKLLAQMEIHKLAHFLDAQRAITAHIDAVATAFINTYPEALPEPRKSKPIYLILGSERGFCGDFNKLLLKQVESLIHTNNNGTPKLIAIGRKLCAQLETDPRVAALIDGANVIEEAEKKLFEIINTLAKLQTEAQAPSLIAIYHDPDKEQIITTNVLPPFEKQRTTKQKLSHPPLLNLPQQVFLSELIEHYLFATLHKIMYTSLMAENLHRARHLEGAIQHLDDKSTDLIRQCNALRQEEIIEEIEVILLSTASPDDNRYNQKSSANYKPS